jgi:two-component sensor histidine kinase
MHSEDGSGFLASAVDVTDIKRREEGNFLLMRELSHRSKNLLAIVQAMARQTAKATPSPAEFYERFGARLRALAAGHDLLVKAAYTGADLGDLLRSQIGPLETLIGSRIFAFGPIIRLRPEAAQNLGMAFHELATNAQVHGALTSPHGRIDIGWRIEGAGLATLLILDWIESRDPSAVPNDRRGFGSTLIMENLPRSLHGVVTLEHLAGGSRCHMELPFKYIIGNRDGADESQGGAERSVFPGAL